jgi:hypothetical protein
MPLKVNFKYLIEVMLAKGEISVTSFLLISNVCRELRLIKGDIFVANGVDICHAVKSELEICNRSDVNQR